MSMKDDLFAHVKRTQDLNEFRIDDNSHRYAESWLYYLGERPLNMEATTEGEDETLRDYVEPVVYNAVTSIVPQILDIFTENDEQPVVFRDHSFKHNPVMEELINNLVTRTVLRENDGYKTLEVALKETLITGDAFTKVYIDEKHDEDTLDLNDWSSMEDVIANLSQKDWKTNLPEALVNGTKKGSEGSVEWRTIEQANPDPNAMSMGEGSTPVVQLRGTLKIYKVDKKIVIENVGLKDLIIDTTCGEDFSKCRYICHKMNMTVGEAMSLGYKKGILSSASTVNRLGEAPYNKFNLVTNAQIGNDGNLYDDAGDELERLITIYEHYLYSSIPSNGKESKLYQVHTTDTELLDYEEVTEIPFVHGQMEIIPDSFWGRSMYDICKHYQDDESTMQRLALKNMTDATFNKLLVQEGQFDAESVINSQAPGAVLIQKQQGGIQQFPYTDLSQSYASALEKLVTSRQETVGRTSGSITTQDGIPNDTAAATVAMVLAQEGLKDKVIAKTFARTYIKPLYEKIYSVIKDNGMTIVIPAGAKLKALPDPLPQDVTITTDSFPSVYDFEVDVNTNGDVQVENSALRDVMTLITSIPTGGMVSEQAKYKVARKLLSSVSLNIEDYFDDPSKQQPDPSQQEMQAFQKEGAKVQLQKLIADLAKTTAETAKIEAEMGNSIEAHKVDQTVKLTESQAKVQKVFNDAKIASDKLDLDGIAIGAEIHNQQKDISIKNANTLISAHKAVNGVRV